MEMRWRKWKGLWLFLVFGILYGVLTVCLQGTCVDLLKDLCDLELLFSFPSFSRGCREQPMSPIKPTMSAGIREGRWWGPEVASVVAQFGWQVWSREQCMGVVVWVWNPRSEFRISLDHVARPYPSNSNGKTRRWPSGWLELEWVPRCQWAQRNHQRDRQWQELWGREPDTSCALPWQ